MAASSNVFLKIALVGGAFGLGYMAWAKKKLPILDFSSSTPAPVPASGAKGKTKKPVPLSAFPLQRGSKGEYVKTLQLHLGVGADGIFGPATEAALWQRYGKRHVITLAELKTMVSTNTSVPARPATRPSLPTAKTAKPALPSPSTKPIPATAAPVTPPADAAKALTGSMWTVFNAIWSKTGGSPVYTERFFGDWKAIVPVLALMSDSYLKGFALAYGRSFKGLVFAKEDKRTGTLLGDMQRIKKDRVNAAYFVQLARVQKLLP